MKVLFIYPDIGASKINFCPSVQVLSSVLKGAGHSVSLLHINDEFGVKYDKGQILPLTKDYDLYAFTATSFNYKYANEIAGWFDGLKILGGCHATIQPEDFESSNFDIFCVGEGEGPMTDLANALENGEDWNNIPNLITRKKRNPVRPFIRDLNTLPFNDFDILNTPNILEAKNGWLSIAFSRGCPYACTFCINHLYKKIEIGDGNMNEYMRKRSPENTVAEMLSLVKKYDIKVFNFDDDLLTMDKRWMREFSIRYRKEIYLPYGIKYAINSRATFIDKYMAGLLNYSGCHEVRIGFETGNEQLRNSVLKKGITDKALEDACKNLDEVGVKTDFFTMLGIPGETLETFHDTVNMVAKLKPKLIRITFLFPYKHTQIYDVCEKEGLFKENFDANNDRTESPLKFPSLTDKDLFLFKFLFGWYVNVSLGIKSYDGVIDLYIRDSIKQLKEQIEDIVYTDGMLSEKCKVPHYRFLANNTNYLELYDTCERMV